MKQGFYFLMLIIGIGLVMPKSWEQDAKSKEPTIIEKSWTKNMGLTELPNNNYYSGTLSEKDIRHLSLFGIHTIVRLNGTKGRDRGHLSIDQERRLCHSLGIQFIYMNIEGRVEASAKEIAALMHDGYTVVHCRNGVHRAPSMAAYYLKTMGVDRDVIIDQVGWTELIKSPGKYERYMVTLPV